MQAAWAIDEEVEKLQFGNRGYESDYYRLGLTKLKQSFSHFTAVTLDAQISRGIVRVSFKTPMSFGVPLLTHLAKNALLDLHSFVCDKGGSEGLVTTICVQPRVLLDGGEETRKGVILYQQMEECKFKVLMAGLDTLIAKDVKGHIDIAVAFPSALNVKGKPPMATHSFYFTFVGPLKDSALASFSKVRDALDKGDNLQIIRSSVLDGNWFFFSQSKLDTFDISTLASFGPPVAVAPSTAATVSSSNTEKLQTTVATLAAPALTVATEPLQKTAAPLTPTVASPEGFMKELSDIYTKCCTKTIIDGLVAANVEKAKTIMREGAAMGFKSASLHLNSITRKVSICNRGQRDHHLFDIPNECGQLDSAIVEPVLFEAFAKAIPFSTAPNKWVWAQ